MPTPFQSYEVPRVLIQYLSRRQLAGRPTTLYAMSTRMGLGSSYLMGLMDSLGVTYSLISHAETERTQMVEILVCDIPESLAYDAKISAEKVKSSYEKAMKDRKAALPADPSVIDVYVGNRLNDAQFEILKKDLINQRELIMAAKEKGFGRRFIIKASSGRDYIPPSRVWIPYLYRNKRYYHRQILKHLSECLVFYEQKGRVSSYKEKFKAERDEIARKYRLGYI